ncbi:MAG: LysR family transcriptional regulator [Succinivibrio sp.]|nr:LysR family transcriptional regulator [Succinivibrio sp.]
MQRYLALQKILETGSFSKAASVLFHTQSSVSQMIKSLEDELGLKLLKRSRNGVELTIEGKEIYPFIQRAINSYNAILDKALELKGLDTGIIRVGTISSITVHWMPKLIKGFQKLYPKVQFLFHQGDYSSIPQWINEGSIDFGFVNPIACPDLMTIPIKDGEFMAVVPPKHKLASKDKVSLKDLTYDPYILLEEGHYSEPLKAFEKENLKPKIKYTVHDDYAIMTMIEQGLGIGILAKLVLNRTNYDIKVLPIEPPIYRHLAVGFKEWGQLPIASKIFIEYMQKHVNELD